MSKLFYKTLDLNETYEVKQKLVDRKYWYAFVKRILDIFISFVLLIIALPGLLLFSFIIYLQTGLNPIYIQKRGLSLNKFQFNIYKLRTLYPSQKHHTDSNIFIQNEFKDSIIPIGRFLRKTGIDEFPQLINVLLGNMSLIGPRPLANNDLNIIKETDNALYMRRESINVKPGITGYWQIFGNREKGFVNMVELEEYYKLNRSLSLDLFLMVMTVPLMLFAMHSDAISN